MKTIQFYTKINTTNGFRGAQIKTWDFYNHINSHPDFKSSIAFHPESTWEPFVYWSKEQLTQTKCLNNPYGYLLKGGNDWMLFKKKFSKQLNQPVISPIVNFRVLDENHPSNLLLKDKAIRVCPCPELSNRLKENKNVNGPVLFIPNGITAQPVNIHLSSDYDILIIALKNPNMGKCIYNHFKDKFKVKLLDQFVSNDIFRQYISASRITVHLPKPVEAHYMPGLESMSLGSITIMPDCIGNRFYCSPNKHGFLTKYNQESIIQHTQLACELSEHEREKIVNNAQIMSNQFTLENEKNKWHQLLDNIEALWNN